jgi:hypothetical protein
MPVVTWIEELIGLLIILAGIYFGVPALCIALKYLALATYWVLCWVWWPVAITGRWWADTGREAWGFTKGAALWIWKLLKIPFFSVLQWTRK